MIEAVPHYEESAEATFRRDVMSALAKGEQVDGHFMVIVTRIEGEHEYHCWTNNANRRELWGAVLEGMMRAMWKLWSNGNA